VVVLVADGSNVLNGTSVADLDGAGATLATVPVDQGVTSAPGCSIVTPISPVTPVNPPTTQVTPVNPPASTPAPTIAPGASATTTTTTTTTTTAPTAQAVDLPAATSVGPVSRTP